MMFCAYILSLGIKYVFAGYRLMYKFPYFSNSHVCNNTVYLSSYP